MELPTCVIDAKTLIEYIHEIKAWFYDGHLRLAVPLYTIERVDQLYQKAKEEQQVKKPEPPRQKSSLKNARKEYPTFDINLRVAVEFLGRLKSGETRGLFVFQQQSEEYSPWKVVDIPTEKRESKEDRPTTFAQAVMVKQNTANGSAGGLDAAKGLVKPRLVARASSADPCPWKMNKNAPRVPASAVLESVRPLLSYALWRLYENVITRNDANPLIVLSDDSEICNAARKLNLTVKRVEELRHYISIKKSTNEDRNIFGDLERKFGFREARSSPLVNGALVSGVVDASGEKKEDQNITRPEEEVVQGSKADGEVTTVDTKETEIPAYPSEPVVQIVEHQPEVKAAEVQNWLLATDQWEQSNVQRHVELDDLTSNGDQSEKAGRLSVHNFEDQVEGKPLHKPVGQIQHDVAETPEQPCLAKLISINSENAELSASNKPVLVIEQDKEQPLKTEILTKAETANLSSANIDIASANDGAKETDAATQLNGLGRASANTSPERAVKLLYKSQPQFPKSMPSIGSGTSNPSTPSSRRSSNESSSTSAEAVQDPYDSDEEVVVFNPRAKRMVAQSKPAEESPKAPSVVKTSPDSNQYAGTYSLRNQPSPNRPSHNQAPRKQAPRNQAPRNQGSYNQGPRKQGFRNPVPRDEPAPAIIDPDFFGRSSAVNIRVNPHPGRPRPSPRGSPGRGPKGQEPDVEYVLTSGATREAVRGKDHLKHDLSKSLEKDELSTQLDPISE